MIYDMLIVGGGPAGMTAAIYGRRAGKSVLVVERGSFGGQMTHSPKIENYPGFPAVSGNELSEHMADQMMALGADVEIDTAVSAETDGEIKRVTGEFGVYEGRTLILAVGVEHRKLGVPGEDGKEGVSYCAVCDGAFYKDRDVVMVGGGNSALQEALLLSQTSRSVTILQDLPFLTGEQALIDAIAKRENVTVVTGARVLRIEGDDSVTGVTASADGAEKTFPCDGVFIAIGLKPENEPYKEVAKLNDYGYFDADETCLAGDGVYVAGDCRAKTIRQITTATADGASAALAAIRYLG